MQGVVRIINLVFREYPTVHTKPFILGHAVVDASYPVYGKKKIHYQTKRSHNARTVSPAAKTLEKPEKKR